MSQNFEIAPRELWRDNQTYDEAVMYCFFLEHEGKKGWRLPHSYGWRCDGNDKDKHDPNGIERYEDNYVEDEEDTISNFNSNNFLDIEFWVNTDHSSIFRHELFTTIPVRSDE